MVSHVRQSLQVCVSVCVCVYIFGVGAGGSLWVCVISIARPDHKQKKSNGETSEKRLCERKENSHTRCKSKISNGKTAHSMARPDKGSDAGARCSLPLSPKRCSAPRQKKAHVQAGLGTACLVYAKLKTFSSFVVGRTFTTSELRFGLAGSEGL